MPIMVTFDGYHLQNKQIIVWGLSIERHTPAVLGRNNEIHCFILSNFFSNFMRTCAIYKYIILICVHCTMKFFIENGIKQLWKSSRDFKRFEAGSMCEKISKVLGFEAYSVSDNRALVVDIIIYMCVHVYGPHHVDYWWSIIDNNHELDRILESIHEFRWIRAYRLANGVNDDSSQEHMGVWMAPALDIRRTSGLARREESLMELLLGADPCQRSSLSSPPLKRLLVLGYKNSSPKNY